MTQAILLALAAAVAPGQKAPAFSLETTSGKKTLDDYKGQTLKCAGSSAGLRYQAQTWVAVRPNSLREGP